MLTADEVFAFLVATFGLSRDALSVETALFSSGMLDSFDLVELLPLVEGAIGRKVLVLDMTLDNFDDVERILAFVERARLNA